MKFGIARLSIVALLVTMAACAERLPPVPLVTSPQYPEFVYPAVPDPLNRDVRAAARHDRGWRLLQANDLRAAQREFAAALKENRRFFPSDTGLGYVFLAQKDYKAALDSFDVTLRQVSNYAPALFGRGDALLGLDRPFDALKAFQMALATNPSLTVAAERVQVLHLRTLQAEIDNARRASDAGRYTEAREAYTRAIAASPESAFLYRDLAGVERKQGDDTAALESFRKAAAMDSRDARSRVQIGELLEARGDYTAAIAAYTEAAAIEPGRAIGDRIEKAREGASAARMPAAYRALAQTPRLARGDLAALIGVHFADLLSAQEPRESVVITDTRGDWAEPWILSVVRAGIMDVNANHTFQPRSAVRRLDLARAMGRLIDLAAASGAGAGASPRDGAQPQIADMPASHLGYAAAAHAVAAGVMPLFEDGTFRPGEIVAGEEALQVIDRVEAVIGGRS